MVLTDVEDVDLILPEVRGEHAVAGRVEHHGVRVGGVGAWPVEGIHRHLGPAARDVPDGAGGEGAGLGVDGEGAYGAAAVVRDEEQPAGGVTDRAARAGRPHLLRAHLLTPRTTVHPHTSTHPARPTPKNKLLGRLRGLTGVRPRRGTGSGATG